MNNDIDQINTTNWHDYYFEKLELDYDDIKVFISSESDERIEIICKEHIGVLYLGHWDESVIRSIKVQNGAEITNDSLTLIKANYRDMILGGGYRSIDNKWYELIIEFIDDNKLTIVCSRVTVCMHEGV